MHVSRREHDKGPIDDALDGLGLTREIGAIAEGFSAALALAQATNLVATVHQRHTGKLYDGMFSFALPMPVPAFTMSMLGHLRC